MGIHPFTDTFTSVYSGPSEYRKQSIKLKTLAMKMPKSFPFAFQDGRHPSNPCSLMLSAWIRSAGRLAACAAILALSSCADGSSRYRWKTSDEALEEYRVFLDQSRTATGTSMESISKDIVAWQTLEDSVVAFVSRDTTAASKPHSFPMDAVASLHDSVRDEILNRARAQPRTLKDVYVLKRSTSRCSRDPTVARAAGPVMPFFLSLDSVNIYNADCKTIVRQYSGYLYDVRKRGIHDKRQWLAFMREEDRLFRSFVPHLHEMGGMSAGGITKTTEDIYTALFQGPASDSISRDDFILYTTMRSSRRLLTAALGCAAGIKANKVKDAGQLQACLWMIMQPFISIDDLGMALLTGRQEKEFETLAKDAPAAIRSIASKAGLDKEETLAMPDLLVKIYISSL